jgi:uncharacterized RDD family membrane protein YckC
VKQDGEQASLARIVFLRVVINYLAGLVLLLLPYFLVDGLFIFGESRRCVHDFIAGTVVVKA